MNRLGNACFALVLGSHCSMAVPPGSAVFVRSGAAAWQTRRSDVLLDVNHALIFPQSSDPSVLTAGDSDVALTVLGNLRITPGAPACVRLIDSATFLGHYRAFFGRDDADAVRRTDAIVSMLLAGSQKPATQSAHSPSYGRLMQHYLNATLAQPFSLRNVAATCALSPFTASRVFHREIGVPLRTYVRRLRLRTALVRIVEKRDFSHVALELGFFDHAHFTRAFRAEFGMTPSEWRQLATAAIVAAA